MASSKVVTVFGATGNQGGAVARSLSANTSTFSVRAITRNPASASAQALQAAGITVVKADGWDSTQMIEAFKGSWAAFVNFNSDDPVFRDAAAPTEFDLGRKVMDSAVAAGVQHLVFSSGPPCTELTGGKVNMKAMNMKYKIEQYVRGLGKFKTTTFINAGWFMENFLVKEVAPIFGGFPWFPDEEGYLTFKVPKWGGKENVPWLSVTRDYGDLVHGILLDPERYNGRVIHAVSQIASFDDMTASFQQASGKKARYSPVLPDWKAFDTHGIEELEDVKLMFGFAQTTGGRYMGDIDTESDSAAELKTQAAKALDKSGQLITLQTFFAQEFVDKHV